MDLPYDGFRAYGRESRAIAERAYKCVKERAYNRCILTYGENGTGKLLVGGTRFEDIDEFF